MILLIFYAIYFSKLKSPFSGNSQDLSALCPVESVIVSPISPILGALINKCAVQSWLHYNVARQSAPYYLEKVPQHWLGPPDEKFCVRS